jgi:hypothetical protein
MHFLLSFAWHSSSPAYGRDGVGLNGERSGTFWAILAADAGRPEDIDRDRVES